MKTKNLALFLTLCGLITSENGYAQRFYISAGGGYAFSTKNVLGYNYLDQSENVYGTYGEGWNTSIVFGYAIADYISIEAGYNYLNTEGYEFKSGDPRYPQMLYTTLRDAKMMRVFTDVKITGGKKIKPYAKFGFVYGVNMDVTISSVTFPDIYIYKYHGGSAPGLFGALGVDYKCSNKISVFVEANILNQNYAPSKLEYFNGIDSKTYELADEVQNQNNSTSKLKPSFPFSSIGINAGVTFFLGGKKTDAEPSPPANQ